MPGRLFFLCISTLLLLVLGTNARAQSLALEGSWAYHQRSVDTFGGGFKLGFRATYPVNERVGLYLNPYWFGGFGLDAGAWYTLLSGPGDLEGVRAYLGVGGALIRRQVGFALTVAFGYEINPNLELRFVYTHRPLFLPQLSQDFDVTLGLAYQF